MRHFLAGLCLLFVASVAAAQSNTVSFVAVLNGQNEKPNVGDPDGTGYAFVRFDRRSNQVFYAITSANTSTPTVSHIHRGGADVSGPVVIDFRPVFRNGAASGVVSADATLINEILATPSNFYVNVHTADFPSGAIRGQLVPAPSGGTDVVFPIAGRVPGVNNTLFRTDLTILNLSGTAAPVALEYYPSGQTGNNGPSASFTFVIANNSQLNLNDLISTTLGINAGTGAIRIQSPNRIDAVGRVYNDLRPSNGGTLSQFIHGLNVDYNRTSGALPMLANQTGASGYRTNIGWFNNNSAPGTLTLRAHRSDGTVLATSTFDVNPFAQTQLNLSQIFPSLEPLEQMYVTYETTAVPMFVYASVVDNTTGDGVFIAGD